MSGRKVFWQSLLLVGLVGSLVLVCEGSDGDERPGYRACVQGCEQTGCVDGQCYNSCNFPVNVDLEGNILPKKALNSPHEKFLEEPLYLRWKKWDCISECRYHCMVREELGRQAGLEAPVKYHGRWPFVRFFSLQEPASVAFSALNLLVHFQGFSSFLVLVYYKLPSRAKGPYYEYVGLWTIYGLLSMNSWIWSTVFHSRDMTFTEMVDYSSAIALLGFSLMLAIIRTGNLRAEAPRVMVAAPIIAFISTHILYLNLYKFDYDLNMIVCAVLVAAQLLIWATWGYLTSHPARFKLWTVAFGAALASLLEIFDFPPLWGIFDAHALWHAATLPIAYLWWSFIKDDATYRTKMLVKKNISQAPDFEERKKTQ
ncbi:hypothetical protein M758_3G109700 [Ceratodon purpureus]|nr:hypothetical protein M758_3G109700 [Ceratodon purpureus]